MRAVATGFVRVLTSLGLSCVLLVLLGLLTWLGTLEQVHSGLYEVQKKYFESFFLVHRAGPLAIPLPGANLVLCVLFANLLAGGIVRLRKDWTRSGILVTHCGILLLLAAGYVKLHFSDDGHVTLFEGQRANHFESYYRWEIAVSEDLGGGRSAERVAPQELFAGAAPGRPIRLVSPELPFELEVESVMANCRPQLKGPMFDVAVPVVDGVFLQEQPLFKDAEGNVAGAYVTAVDKRGGTGRAGILWGRDLDPWTVRAGDKAWTVELRHERYPMPFTLVLDDFTKEDHPGINMPRSFESDVTLLEGSAARALTISMNEPLRDEGLVVYQASWGPSTARPGDPLFSTFSVVRNPADQFPLYACIVIATGLLLHFSRKLVRHIRLEARTA